MIKEFKEYPGYFITDKGEVIGTRGKVLACKKKTNVLSVGIRKYGTSVSIPKVMKQYFLGNCKYLYYKDGNMKNCNLNNLCILGEETTTELIIKYLKNKYPNEIFKSFYKGFYFISNKARVLSFTLGIEKELSQYNNPRGYLRFKLENNKHFETHRVMGRVFLNANPGFTDCVHHIDMNKHNNNLDNLIILSPSEHSKLHAKKFKIDRDNKNGRIKGYHVN